jgi:hypothetical protein
VQLIRRRLRAHGISERWSNLRDVLAGQCRVTATFRRADGRTLHVRQATRAEPAQLAIRLVSQNFTNVVPLTDFFRCKRMISREK